MTLNEALQWVNSKGQEFGRAHGRIIQGRERAASFARALPPGSEERAEAGKTVDRWSHLLEAQQTAMARWENIASRIPGLDHNLGIVPVVPIALAGTVVAVAISMSVVLRKLSAEERALKLLENGRITPAEAIELAENLEGGRGAGFAAGLGSTLPLVAAGLLAFFMWRAR